METADTLAREHTKAAIDTLAEVMDSDLAKPSERIAAANSLLDRAYGKPVSAVITVPVNQKRAAQLAQMDDSALLALIAAQRIADPKPRAIEHAPLESDFDVEVEDIDADPFALLE